MIVLPKGLYAVCNNQHLTGGLKKGDRYTHTTYGWRALVELMIVDFLGSGSAVGFC